MTGALPLPLPFPFPLPFPLLLPFPGSSIRLLALGNWAWAELEAPASCVMVLMACWCLVAMSCLASSDAAVAVPPVVRKPMAPVTMFESTSAAFCSSQDGGDGMLVRAQVSAPAVLVTAVLVLAALSAWVCILLATACDCWKYAS